MQTTISCLIQNRLGSLDRVLGALTYRGIIPQAFQSTLDPVSGHIHITFTFDYDSDHGLEKLVKILNKQVTVLHAYVQNSDTEVEPGHGQVQSIPFLNPTQSTPQRRVLNA